jgi:hypothetical protein
MLTAPNLINASHNILIIVFQLISICAPIDAEKNFNVNPEDLFMEGVVTTYFNTVEIGFWNA